MKLSRVELDEVNLDPKTGKDGGYGGKHEFVVEDGYELELDYNNRVSIKCGDKVLLVPFQKCRYVLPAQGEWEQTRPTEPALITGLASASAREAALKQTSASYDQVNKIIETEFTFGSQPQVDQSEVLSVSEEFPETLDPEPEPTPQSIASTRKLIEGIMSGESKKGKKKR